MPGISQEVRCVCIHVHVYEGMVEIAWCCGCGSGHLRVMSSKLMSNFKVFPVAPAYYTYLTVIKVGPVCLCQALARVATCIWEIWCGPG